MRDSRLKSLVVKALISRTMMNTTTTFTITMMLHLHPWTNSKVREFLFFSQTSIQYVDEGETHMLELSKLAEKDPEFYKYLQDHDRELLEFSMDVVDDDDHVDDTDDTGESDGDQLPTLTENILRTWQKSLLEVCVASFLRDRIKKRLTFWG
jgi:hypothetical protein